jgi:hypothetical protein
LDDRTAQLELFFARLEHAAHRPVVFWNQGIQKKPRLNRHPYGEAVEAHDISARRNQRI